MEHYLDNISATTIEDRDFVEGEFLSSFDLSYTVVVGTLTLLFNLLAICAICKKKLHKNSNRFNYIISLCCGDDVAAVGIVLRGIIYGLLHSSTLGCRLLISIQLVTLTSMNILVLSVEQFLAVRFPFVYILRMTKRIVYVTIASVWLYGVINSIVISSVWIVDPYCSYIDSLPIGLHLYAACMFIFLPITLAAVLQFATLRISRRHLAKIRQSCNGQSSNSHTGDSLASTQGTEMAAQVRRIVTNSLVVWCLVVCWIPNGFNLIFGVLGYLRT